MRRVAACLLVALCLHLNRKHQPGQTNNILMSRHDGRDRDDPFLVKLSLNYLKIHFGIHRPP